MTRDKQPQAIAEASAQALPFSGITAVARGSRPVYERAFGFANREDHLRMTTKSRFQVGSISKWFTVIVALKLAEQGDLDLNAPIGHYLAEYPEDIGKRVTVANVLSNTSGIMDRLPTQLINDPRVAASTMTAREAVHVYAEGPLTFQPGSQFDYSHTNWVLAQAILEKAGGSPLEDLLHSLIFEPLHLKATGVTHGSFERVPDHAIAYASGANGSRKLHIIPNFLIPTGTIYSDCDDLIRVAHAVYNDGFLNAASLKALNAIRWAPEEYALGGRVKHRLLGGRPKTIAFEIGSSGGFKALIEHVIEDDVTVVTLNNSDMDQDELARIADNLLLKAYSSSPTPRR